MKFSKVWSLILLCSSQGATAQLDIGQTSYTQFCSACHGKNGEGLSVEGNSAAGIPPLSQSEWLKGDADRVAQILLHGLEGPITVKGRSYNQIMPAQGALSDEQAVAVINYVRREFVGEKANYTLGDFKLARKFSKDRKKGWKAKELQELYPLPRPVSPIKNLLIQTYDGEWEATPNFSEIKSNAIEEEHDGYISLKKINKKKLFGVMWEGDFVVTKKAIYEFELDSDDGSRLTVGGNVVTSVKGMGGMGRRKIGKISLEPGSHKFRLEYFQNRGGKGLTLRYRERKTKWKWLSDAVQRNQPEKRIIDITPKDGKVRMYSNFIAGSTHRTMGVAYPHENNIAFSTENCNLDLIWKGDFINAGRHWVGRGQGAEAPASKDVVRLFKSVPWLNADGSQALKVKLKGYSMDKTGSPTFSYLVDSDLMVSDHFVSSAGSFQRVMNIESKSDREILFKISAQGAFKNGIIYIGDLMLKLPADTEVSSQGKSYHLKLSLKKGSNPLTILYTWKK